MSGDADATIEVLKKQIARLKAKIQAAGNHRPSTLPTTENSLKNNQLQQFLDNIINAIPDPIFVKDEQHRWIILNIAYCEFMGYTKEELLGKSDFDFFPKEEAEVFWAKDDEVFRSEKENINVELFTDSTGETHVIETKKAIFRDDQDNKVLVGIIRDITHFRRLEEERLRASKLESIGLLAGGIAHDFNNILTGILGYINIAGKLTPPESRIGELLRKAEEASFRATGLTRQLLTFSKGGEPIKTVTYLHDVVRDSTELVLRGTAITCEFDFPVECWPVEIDIGQISQVINNLVINSVQAMPESGNISIRCENIERTPEYSDFLSGDRYVRISIRDEGSGISEEDLPRVFDPYFTTKTMGSGLGLATSYSIIKRHQGHITLDSKPGKGTTAVVYIPATDKPVRDKIVPEGRMQRGEGRILFMDDEKIVREAAGMMLKDLGYRVEYACTGGEAIRNYILASEQNDRFDLVIMDLTVPGGMGGAEAVTRLKAFDPDLKAIVSSGYLTDPILSNFRNYGFQGFLAKPYQAEELGRIIYKVLNPAGET
ncbi:PAS domain S-box protein [bacterium]|nr:PAS domain S-box protein [candidate division CSSED10-310 bacterium]